MLPLKLKLALRTLLRSSVFTYVNTLGLAISIGMLITIFIYVNSELRTDTHLSDRDEIYRLVRKVEDANSTYQSPTLAGPFRELLSYDLNIPEEDILRMYQDDELVRYKHTAFFEPNFLYVDSNFFEILDYPFRLGNPHDILKNLNAAVISDRIAKKYFGEGNPIGEILEIDGKGLVEIKGVLDKPLANSHLQIDFVVNNQSMGYAERFLTDGDVHSMTYYLRIPSRDRSSISTQLQAVATKHLNSVEGATRSSLYAQPVADIYFDKPMQMDSAKHGNRSFLQTLIAISLILSFLLVANFINLTIAKLTHRLRQIGVKKILGSSKSSLVFDWGLEVYLIVLVATCLGAVGCNFILPLLINTYELELVLADNLTLFLWGFMFTVLLTGFIVFIPGWLFSSVKSFSALSNKLGLLKTHVIQYALLLFQFTVAFVLIVFTVVINRQYQFMQSKEIGIEDDQVLVFNSNNKHSWKNRDFIRNEIRQLSGVKDVSTTYGGLPTGPTDAYFYQVDQRSLQWNTAFIQPNFIDLLGLKVLSGKAFDEQIASEIQSGVLLNATAASELGWPERDLVGQFMDIPEDSTSKRILGIVQDHHYTSIKERIEPLVFQSTGAEETFLVKMEGSNYATLLPKIENIWQRYAPQYPFSYQLLNETYTSMHREDTKNGKVIFFFTFLTIVIAVIGTLSLMRFIQQVNMKEFAIRKILGASLLRVFYAQSSSLLRVLLAAGLVAVPFAWLVSSDWLSDFGYRISLSPGMFLIAYGGLIGILLILIVGQSWKVLTSNPMDSLK